MSKSNKNLNKNQEVNMENVKTENVNVEEKGFFEKLKDSVKAHKNILIAGAVGMGLGAFAGVSLANKKHESEELAEDDSYDENSNIDDMECLELMNEDNMSNENEEVVE